MFAAALLATLAACVDAPTASAPDLSRKAQPGAPPSLAMNANSSRVVGYLPNWYSGSLDAIRFSKLTHVIYAFVEPTATGELTGIPMSGDARLTSVVQKAHAAGTKVLISIGGWSGSTDSGFEPMAASATARTTFVNNVVTFVANYNLDGADIDWEFPVAADSANYALLIDQLQPEMASRGKLLTAAVAAYGIYGWGIPTQAFSKLDFLTIMAYDGSISSQSYSHAVTSLDYWRNDRNLPQSRTVLGVPFYGTHSTEQAKRYGDIVAGDPQAPYKDESNGFHYNGLATMKQKTALALDRGSGVGVWHVAQDTTLASISLLQAIHDAMDGVEVVYDDALTTGWANWSWGTTVNFANTSPVYLGSKSISASYTKAWAGLYVHHDTSVSPAGLTKLEFYIHGGTSGGQNLAVQLGDTGGWRTVVPLNSYVDGGSVAANAWRKVSIPLSALGITTLGITDVVIQENAGVVPPTYYVDQIQFVP